MPELSLIVPCLNEADNLEEILGRLNEICLQHQLDVETIMLDDASEDRTLGVAEQLIPVFPALHIRVFRRALPRRGYGAVVRFGLAHAIGTYSIFVAADGVDPIHLIPEFLRRMRAGADLVQCSRYLNPGEDATIPFRYKFSQVIFRFFVRLIFGQAIRDSTYAFKMFKRIDMLAVGLTSNRFSISPEITFKVLLGGGRVEYVASGQGVRLRGQSKFVFRREGLGYGYVLLRALLHRLGVLWF